MVIEDNSDTYLNFLTPEANAKGLFFGDPASPVRGSIVFNDSTVPGGLLFRTEITPRMVIDSAGNVGIGLNTAPERRLHVSDGLAGAVVANANAVAVLERDTHTYLALLTPDANEKGINFGSPANAVHGGIYYTNAAGLAFRTGGNITQMALSPTGDLGVGAPASGARLRVQGAAGTGDVWITPTTSGGNSDIRLTETTSGSFGMVIRHNGASNLLEFIGVQSGAENASPNMTIGRGNTSGVNITNGLTVGGSVGVGTTTPGATLDVAGEAEVDGLTSEGDIAAFFGTGNSVVINTNTNGHGLNINTLDPGPVIGKGEVRYDGDSLKLITGGAGDANPTNGINIDNTGRVGIGIELPTVDLDIRGPDTFTAAEFQIADSNRSSFLHISSGTDQNTDPPTILFSYDGNLGGVLRFMQQFSTNPPFEAMRIDGGRVGIGDTDPTFKLELPNIAADSSGRGRANAWTTYSSIRWKQNVRTIENALGKVMQLRGVRFDWKPEHGGKADIGFVAEEVGQVVPEIVSWEADRVYAQALAYDRITALAVEAIKEQQQLIERQQDEIERQQAALAEVQSQVDRLNADAAAKERSMRELGTTIAELASRLERLEVASVRTAP